MRLIGDTRDRTGFPISLRGVSCLLLICCLASQVSAQPVDSQNSAPTGLPQTQANLRVWPVDSLLKIFRDDRPRSEQLGQPATDNVARGEYASLQFAILSNVDLSDVRVSVSQPLTITRSDDSIELDVARISPVGFVPVDRPTQEPDPDSLRTPPADFPDPLLEDPVLELKAGNAQPYWITVPVPSSAAAGKYLGKVQIQAEAIGKTLTTELPVSVHVHRVVVGKSRLWSACWFAPKLDHLGVSTNAFSDQYWDVLREYARNLAAHRQNVVKISPFDLAQYGVGEDSTLTIDLSRFDKTVQIFFDEGVIGRIEGGHFAKRKGGWETPFVVKIRKVVEDKVISELVEPTSFDAERFVRTFYSILTPHLKERGWLSYYLQHVGDEPTDATKESYETVVSLLRRFAPDIQVIDATHTPNLAEGTMDVWMPVLSELAENYLQFQRHMQRGDEVWTYTCHFPKGKWANRFLEQPLLKTRLLAWINFRYGITGHLNWGYNSWRTKDPFTQMTPKGGPGYLPAGDAWMVYPGDGKPIDSVRFEAWRDGSADYELLSMLDERNPQAAQRLVSRHVKDFSDYDINVDRFRETRRELLELLSEPD